jgi:rubrerythrin
MREASMTDKKSIDILKGAILLEHRGKALYESVLLSSKNEGIRNLFDRLAQEEKKHIKVLNKQFSRLSKGDDFDLPELEKEAAKTSEAVITEEIVNSVSGAGYEAAVISAALEFEKNAVSYYSENAVSAESTDEKKLYMWLTDWEKTHMLILAQLDKELREKIWYDNQFWPLD